MEIQNLVLHPPRVNGDLWTFEADYTAVFTPAEVSQRNNYADNASLREDDDSDDDTIIAPGIMQGWQVTEPRYSWTWTFVVHQGDLNTELGREEIYARIYLQKTYPPPESVVILRDSNIISLDP